MQIVTEAWVSLAGMLALLAGLAGIRRTRRLRRSGVKDWAMVVSSPDDYGSNSYGSNSYGSNSYGSNSYGSNSERSGSRTMLQFSLADGRVVEQVCPRSGRAGRLTLGQKVLVWYDPADPGDVLVFGQHAGRADWIFVSVGLALILAGAGVAAFAT